MKRRIGWRRIRKAARLLADVSPPTGRGWLVALLAGSALALFGYRELDLLLFVAGIAGVALVVLATLAVATAGLLLRRKLAGRGGEVRRLEAGSPIRTGFRAPSLARLPLVELRWSWLEPTGVEVRQRESGGEILEEVVARRRARVETIRRRFSVEDVFGLARFSWETTEAAPLLVLPDVGRLRHVSVVRSFSSSEGLPHPSGAPEGDRMDIRRYVPGDSVRHILWKTFARTRQLNVRVPERSVERSRKTVAYLVTGRGDEPAAAAARAALENGSLGERWLFGADGTDGMTDHLDEALSAIARSGSLGEDGARNGDRGLGRFLERVRSEGEAHCIVFAPATAGAWSEDVLLAARRGSLGLSFVLGLDGVASPEEPPWWQRWLLRPEPPAGTPREELAQVVRHLSGTGCPTLVVDRRSGRRFGEGYQNALKGLPS